MNNSPLHIHINMYYPNLINVQVGGVVKIKLKKTVDASGNLNSSLIGKQYTIICLPNLMNSYYWRKVNRLNYVPNYMNNDIRYGYN